jgi:hypothetical protein
MDATVTLHDCSGAIVHDIARAVKVKLTYKTVDGKIERKFDRLTSSLTETMQPATNGLQQTECTVDKLNADLLQYARANQKFYMTVAEIIQADKID